VIFIADNIRITDSIIEKAIDEFDPQPIQEMTKRCVAAGAEAIDINSGPLNRDPEKKMEFLVESIQDVTELPLLIDTTNPKALEAGLRASKNKTIINGFSLEPVKLKSILPLAEKFKKAGLTNAHLIIDPIVAPLIWQDGNFQDMEILSVIRTLPELLGFDVRTISGLSNLTAGNGDRGKKLLMEETYLPMLLEAGLSMVLVDVFHEKTMRTARACRALMSQKVFSWGEV